MRVPTKTLIVSAILASAGLAATSAQAGIIFADVGKNLEYVQTGPASLSPVNGGDNAFFFARAFYANPADFDGGSLGFSGGPLPYNTSAADCCGNSGGAYQTGYMSRAFMDATYPTGETYTLTSTNSVTLASQSVAIPYLNDLYDTTPLPALDAASFNALQNLNPASGLTVFFNPFVHDPNATFGQTFLSVFDLTAGATVASLFGPSSPSSFFLPAGTFTAGHSYETQLIFDNGVGGQDGGVFTTARSDLRSDVFFDVPRAGAVPEPATWAVMVLGFGLMGVVLRRRDALA